MFSADYRRNRDEGQGDDMQFDYLDFAASWANGISGRQYWRASAGCFAKNQKRRYCGLRIVQLSAVGFGKVAAYCRGFDD